MPTLTSNLKLKKPLQTDFYNVADFNENFDAIDSAVHDVQQSISKMVASNGGMSVVQATLTSTGWTGTSGSYTQIVSINGILADEMKQLIMPMPKASSMSLFDASGIKAVSQGDGTLTFSADCNDAPSSNIDIYVVIMGIVQQDEEGEDS